MSLNEKINKIKITLFGNLWIARIVKWFLYSSVILVGWIICKSEYLFSVGPLNMLKSVVGWENSRIEGFSNALFTLAFAGLLIFAYFCFVNWLVKWLLRINISSKQQSQIFQNKVYNLDKEISYSVEKLDNLEATTSRLFFSHISLKGTLLLDNKKQKKTIDFVCNFSGNLENLETNFPAADIKFKSKPFLTWKIIVLVILSLGTYGYFHQVYEDTKRLEGFPLGQIIKGKAEIQKQIEEEKKEKKKQEEKEERYKKAKITDPQDIEITFDSIGGLSKIKKKCKDNAEAIRQKNLNPKKCFAEPEHMIFYGPPGTGKTLLAKAIAQASGSFFLNLNGNDFAVSVAQIFGNEKGISLEEKIKNIFNIAVQEAGDKTIVVLIDEIDQMGSKNFSGEVGKEFQNILEDRRYKNIKIIATTNWLGILSDALLRPGRLFKKYLVNYPDSKDLLKIIEKVLEEHYEFIKKEKDAPELFGNLSKTAFVNKFAKVIHKEITQTKYMIKYRDMIGDSGNEGETSKIDPEKSRLLFTGADIKQIIFRTAPNIVASEGRRTLKEEDFKRAIEDTYEINRQNPGWVQNAKNYLGKEINALRNQDDDRGRQPHHGPPGPA